MRYLKQYGRGFIVGLALGAVYLTWVYRRAQMFPGDPQLNRYFARLRNLAGQYTDEQK